MLFDIQIHHFLRDDGRHEDEDRYLDLSLAVFQHRVVVENHLQVVVKLDLGRHGGGRQVVLENHVFHLQVPLLRLLVVLKFVVRQVVLVDLDREGAL